MKGKTKRSLGRPRLSNQNEPTNTIILHAATDLFLARGYQKVSIDDIADKCNLTKATVYYYFESKADLFTEAMVELMSRIHDYMNAILKNAVPLRTRLHQVADLHLKATVEIDLDGYMRETQNSLTEDHVQRMKEAEEKVFKALEDAFIEAIASGEIPVINAKFAAHSYINLLKVGNYRNQDQSRIFSSVEETSEKIMEFFWNGLFPK